MDLIRNWFRRNFSNPQVVILAAFLLIGSIAVLFFGEMLAPALTALVIAYLLEGLVVEMERRGIPRRISFLIVFFIFLGFIGFVLLVVLPTLYQQLGKLINDLPSMIKTGKDALLVELPKKYPEIAGFEITEQGVQQIVNEFVNEVSNQITLLSQRIVSISVATIKKVILFLIYLILVPLMVFFFLKDKNLILNWIKSFLPEDRSLAVRVWHDVDQQMGNYIRGKFWEIVIVWFVSHVTFSLFGLNYSMLLSLFIGLSVLLPYIGATAMFVPVALVAYFQFQWDGQFLWVIIAYTIIQTLDGNLLAPLLLSEVTNLHPIAAIIAILVFGGLWGFWGVFFAIPLATLIKAVLKAWPTREPSLEQPFLPFDVPPQRS